MTKDISEWFAELKAANLSTRWHASATRWQVAREASAIQYLQARLSSERFLPPIGGWSADYSLVATVLDAVYNNGGPPTMMELGSGSGTPWFASIVKLFGGELISVEHDLKFVESTSSLLEYYNLADWCSVIHAELAEIDDDVQWYHLPTVLEAVGDRKIDVLIIDGPPNHVSKQPRLPALFQLQDSLEDNALVILDDTSRTAEKETFNEWKSAFGDRIQLLPILDHAIIFRLESSTATKVPGIPDVDGRPLNSESRERSE